MGSLILLFVITLAVILLASFREVRRKNTEMLEHYVAMYSPEQVSASQTAPSEDTGQRPEWREPPMDERPAYRLSTFYSVARTDDGTVLAVDDGSRDVYSEEELIRLAEQVLTGAQPTGRIDNLSYIISRRSDYTLVAFMDNTVSESGLNTLLHTMLIVGGAAILILFILSLFLSKWIIRPLEENDRQQKQFISDASHELKTPIAVISANIELLSREMKENEWLSNIQYENERMGELVKQLLDLSRAENAEVSMEPLDFSRLVTGEILVFDSLAFDQGKTIRSDIAEDVHLMGSQTQLTQLVSILLDNAVRHATGSEIEVSLKRQGHSALLSVSNPGEEIPPEQLEHLFDRFYRVDKARNDVSHYGLGLSIADAVVRRHGGTIHVDCHAGKISFNVSLPEKNK